MHYIYIYILCNTIVCMGKHYILKNILLVIINMAYIYVIYKIKYNINILITIIIVILIIINIRMYSLNIYTINNSIVYNIHTL